ncbi:unnamed protein product, partial [marine sediment metagenome]
MCKFLPFMTCLCPTYKRPSFLRNALACYLAQDYPEDRRQLIIFDDVPQHHCQGGESWHLWPQVKRFDSLPKKFDAMVRIAPAADVFVVWEDDDYYLPSHLSEIAEVYCLDMPQYFVSEDIWSTYGEPQGQAHREGAAGR